MKNENIKIGLIIVLSFLIPLTTVYFLDNAIALEINSTSANEEIFSTNSDNVKVFLFGSSHVMPVDAEYIDKYISLHGKKVDVYNNALNAENPSRRLLVFDQSVSLQPDIVFLGVDAYYFFEKTNSQTSISNLQSKFYGCSEKLPEIQDLYSIFRLKNDAFSFLRDNLGNPKLTSLKLISTIIKLGASETSASENIIEYEISFKDLQTTNQSISYQSKLLDENVPEHFVASLVSLTEKQSHGFYVKKYRIVGDEETIDKSIQTRGSDQKFSRPFNPDSIESNSLRELIERLQDENIKVVTFSTPIHKKLYDIASPCGIYDFEKFLQTLSADYGISHYNLHDQYLEDDIWRDDQHIVHGERGIIYSEDLARVIITEI